MILERFQEQLADLADYLKQVEARGDGAQVVLSLRPDGGLETPKVTIFAKRLTGKRTAP